MWWINADKKWTAVSSKVYYALGFGGNYIIIDNEHDLVVVARWMADDKMGDVLNLIIKSLENN
jgi:CubicO group peptidase (beta-lactamase class C family)